MVNKIVDVEENVNEDLINKVNAHVERSVAMGRGVVVFYCLLVFPTQRGKSGMRLKKQPLVQIIYCKRERNIKSTF